MENQLEWLVNRVKYINKLRVQIHKFYTPSTGFQANKFVYNLAEQ